MRVKLSGRLSSDKLAQFRNAFSPIVSIPSGSVTFFKLVQSANRPELTFGDGEGKVYWKDVAEVMGVSAQKPHEWFLLKKRFPIDCFFKACNAYNLSPFRFLTDPNREKAPRADMTEREEINDLKHRFVELRATVDDLKRKYNELLKSHEQLLHHVQVNINTISGGNISNIGITADPLADD